VSGSNNPLGVGRDEIKVSFHPYYSGKDFTTMVRIILVCGRVRFFLPHLFTEPDNFLPADSLKTPAHITPEWYFLWTYAILRAIPNKLGGVVSMFGAIIVLFFLPKLFRFSRVRIAAFPSLQMLF
jgi:ubiquinol-cytochrome c reductase cytochrome b subunit